MSRSLFTAATAALVVSACVPHAAAPDLKTGNGWARTRASGQASGAIYLTIDNRGDGADRLVAVATPRAATATIHRSAVEGGVMRMRMLDSLPIPAGQRVALTPGGTHIMIAPLAAPLKAGETIELHLRFERSGERRVPVTVVAPGAR